MHKAYISTIPYYRTKPVNTDSLDRESLCSMLVRISRDHLLPISLLLESEFGISFKLALARNAVVMLLFPSENLSYRIYKFTQRTAFTEHVWLRCVFHSISEHLDLNSPVPLKPYKAWCPLCYSEDVSESGCYDRLYWSFSEVDACWKHNTQLASVCYYCGARQSELHVNFPIGCCDSCGRFLGLEHYYVKAQPANDFPGRDEFVKACLSVAGRVVAKASVYASRMRDTCGSVALAERLGVELAYLNAVLSFDTRPSFEFCIKVVEMYGRWVEQGYQYYSQPSDELTFDPVSVVERIDTSAVKNHLDRILKGELPVNTRDSIAEKVGVTNSFLLTHFPEETTEITRMLQSVSQSNRPDDAMKQHLRKVLAQIKEAGHQVKWETVVANLPDELLKNARARDIHAAIRHIERNTMSQAARRSIKRKKTVA